MTRLEIVIVLAVMLAAFVTGYAIIAAAAIGWLLKGLLVSA